MVKINLGGKRRPYLLKKIKNDLYVTNPMSFDEAPSDVGVKGTDPDHKSIDEIIPPVSKPDERKIIFHYRFSYSI
jgi:hypothetical protein